MSLNTVLKTSQKGLKYLSLLVLLATLCYPACVCAHPQPEPTVDTSITEVEQTERITIELAEVAELDKVARFTQLLSESSQLSDLQLTQVQLKADQPERSFVRWSAQMASGTPDDLEQELQSAAAEFEGLKVVHRQSYRGFIAFALNTVVQSDVDDGVFLPVPVSRRSIWPILSGHGFD